jgi:hypothetical protein
MYAISYQGKKRIYAISQFASMQLVKTGINYLLLGKKIASY